MILDTCALLWLASGSKRLSVATRREIEQAPFLYLSAISGFEIAHKEAEGKLQLGKPTGEWFEAVVDHHGLSIMSVDLETCIAAVELPRIHDDPFDRIIIATAHLNGWPVVTEDGRFKEYEITVIGCR